PTSQRGKLRAEMEESIRNAGIRATLIRLPEFYGPNVVSLTARVFAARKRVAWPGHPDATVEFIYMPDAARAMVRAGCAENVDGETFHVPGARTTPRAFIESAGVSVIPVPPMLLHAAGLFDETAAGAADIAHLWTDPVLLDGSKYRQWFGEVPITPYAEGIAATRAWFDRQSSLRLQS
ncbi:MAG TPA: NAD-dependent epimerase/dehydratase family protein, partial [Thermoanaerobaculia bacterium]